MVSWDWKRDYNTHRRTLPNCVEEDTNVEIA